MKIKKANRIAPDGTLCFAASHLGLFCLPVCPIKRIPGLYGLTLKAPNTTIAEFANTADPDETAHNEPSHLDLQCLPS